VRTLLLLAGFGLCALDTACAAEPLVLHYIQSPPLHYADSQGVLTGFAAKPAIAALTAAGIPYEVRQTLAKNQMALLKANEQPACMLSWLQTPERERIGKFTEVIYEDKRPFALTWAGNPAMYNEEDLKDTLTDKRLRVMVQKGVSYGMQIDRALIRYKTQTISTTASAVQLLEMLRQRRIDYFFISYDEAEEAIKASGTPAASYKRIYFSDLYKGYERRLWCSKAVPDDMFKRLNAAIVGQRK
jgi:ABC-type amino acid transport substrate-binding protein